LIGNVDLVNLI